MFSQVCHYLKDRRGEELGLLTLRRRSRWCKCTNNTMLLQYRSDSGLSNELAKSMCSGIRVSRYCRSEIHHGATAERCRLPTTVDVVILQEDCMMVQTALPEELESFEVGRYIHEASLFLLNMIISVILAGTSIESLTLPDVDVLRPYLRPYQERICILPAKWSNVSRL